MAGVSRVITIEVGSLKTDAALNDSHTAREIWEVLPIEGVVSTWGDEVYFSIPVTLGEEDVKELVSAGDLGVLATRHSLLHLLWTHSDEPW